MFFFSPSCCVTQKSQLVTVDHSAPGTMKNAAICGNRLPCRSWFMTDVSNAHCALSHETPVAGLKETEMCLEIAA